MAPFVFFDCVTHFGGSNQVTIALVREMQKYCDVIVLDAYGTCTQYHDIMERHGIKSMVVQPNPRKSYIGGSENPLRRIRKMLANTPEMMQLIIRLRKTINKLSPAAIWTNSGKGLFFLSRAVGKRFPIAFYTHTERFYPKWYSKYDWKNLDLVMGVSQSCFCRLYGSSREPALMEIVPNAIDIDEIIKSSLTKPETIPPGSGLKILLPATLYENKSQDTAIRGLAEYVKGGGDGSLWLAGDVSPGAPVAYQQYLHDLIDELGVSDRVHFLGWRDDLPSLITKCDIVTLVSHSESFGRVLLEAMCLQKPVIGTRVGGIPEVFRDNVDGILIDKDDSKAFAAALKKLADPKIRQKMGQAGFERARTCFDIKSVALRFLELINKISRKPITC